ncbi:aa_trans domain-containing protein [Trichonephila inaurata madagascariensis]|uniref:Aa_trans domain-containing protein n=1 Tax=Trichonephila inaurata madagascariensis TaxID=2747483 RepID=A0A8X6WUB4_9ARAC|nr:aa_trans domain-containing protein [Trichonephila inaurata madagascariensis]
MFPKAASIGFLALLLLYMPVAVLGYYVYGESLSANVLDSLPYSVTKSVISVMLALHMFFAFLLVINAPVQDLEEFLKVPKSFGWKRILLRTTVMAAVVFVAQSIPRFGKVLNLNPDWPDRSLSIYEKVCLFVFIACGIVGGCISTYSAITDIVQPESFKPPCYVNMTAASAM